MDKVGTQLKQQIDFSMRSYSPVLLNPRIASPASSIITVERG